MTLIPPGGYATGRGVGRLKYLLTNINVIVRDKVSMGESGKQGLDIAFDKY